ncbi:MAG: hypothetical protein IT373_08290, partial [Polyangiaceae bacterium]|nr:hypothetical protein [Polyangiaceae bacterium]
MHACLLRLGCALGLALSACGGKAVIDAAGGAGGSAPPPSCAELEQDLLAKNDAATSCNPLLGVVQCSGTATIHDPCACSQVANEVEAAAVAAATQAYQAWTAAGCGPYDCG